MKEGYLEPPQFLRIVRATASAPDPLRSFDQALMRDRVAASSRSRYLRQVRLFLRWLQKRGISDPAEASPRDVLTYRDRLLFDKGFAVTTVKHKLTALRRFYAFLRAEGLPASPMEAVKSPRLASPTAPRAVAVDHVERLISAARTTGFHRDRARNELVVRLIAETGIRLSELLRLRWGDVRLQESTLRIRVGKGLAGRQVPLNPGAHEALLGYWHACHVPADGMFVLTGTNTTLTGRRIEYMLAELARRAGLEDVRVTPHLLRHTFAMRYLKGTGDLMGLAGILGHASIATTALYTRPRVAEAVGKMEALRAVSAPPPLPTPPAQGAQARRGPMPRHRSPSPPA